MKTKELERIVASALARRFAPHIPSEAVEKLEEAQRAKQKAYYAFRDAADAYRTAVEDAVNDTLNKTRE